MDLHIRIETLERLLSDPDLPSGLESPLMRELEELQAPGTVVVHVFCGCCGEEVCTKKTETGALQSGTASEPASRDSGNTQEGTRACNRQEGS